MRLVPRSILVLLAFGSILAGCGDDSGDGGDGAAESSVQSAGDGSGGEGGSSTLGAASTVVVDPVPPAADDEGFDEDHLRSNAVDLDIGVAADFGGETQAVVNGVAVDPAGPSDPANDTAQLFIDVGFTNTSDLDFLMPFVGVACADGVARQWIEAQGGLDPGATLAPGDVVTGTLNLGVPNDCEDPVVRITGQSTAAFEPSIAQWPAPSL